MKRITALLFSVFFFISHVSANLESALLPSLEIVAVERQDCDNSNQFLVDIEIEHDSINSPGFIIRGNGVVYDTFEYGEDFYTVGPLEGDCITIYEFVVADLLDPSCSDNWEFDAPVCCAPCKIVADDIINLDCDTTGYREVEFKVIAENEGQDGFDLLYWGIFIEHFDYGQNSYTVLVPGNGVNQRLTIRDTQFQDCSDLFLARPGDCPNAPECHFDFSQSESITLECTSDTTYNLTINEIPYSGEEDSLIINHHSELQFTVAFKDLPFTIENLSVDNGEYELSFHEPNNIFCDFHTVYETPDCSTFNDCRIYDVIGELHMCNDTSNLVFVDIAFQVDNPVSDSFRIIGNGGVYGTFAYGEPFYTVGPIEANCNQNYEFIVVDLDDPDCQGEFFFSTPPCCEPDECEIFDIVVDWGGCTGDGTFFLYVDFEYENVASDLFNVFSSGNFVGTYAYTDLPLQITNFPEGDGPQDIITICDNDNPDCCASEDFPGPDCTEDDCEIFEINTDPVECVGDGLYSLWLNFEHEGTTSDSFEVFSQGQYIGTFAFADLPVFIEEFPERDVEYDIITICEQDNEECCTTHEFIGLDCTEEECMLWDVNVDPDNCTGDGLYSLWLNFEYEGVDNDFFEVFSQGTYIGIYAFADLPVYIEEFPERDAAFDIITICVNDQPDCCVTHEFEGLDCQAGDCVISEVFAEAYECNEDGEVYFDLIFNYENEGDAGFTVLGNGMNYGNFEYGEPFYTLGPVPGDCSTIYEFVVIDNEFIDCEAFFEFEEPICCAEELCLITDIAIDLGECTGDGVYSLWLNFEYENVTNDFFDVFSNGDLVGTYAYEDLPVFIEEFPERDAEYDIITICDNDNPDCCASWEFIGLDCAEGACAIFDIVVDPLECTGDGLYSIALNFEHQNTTNEFFDVYSNGEFVGFYAYEDLPVVIPNFPERDAEYDIIQICDNDNPNCCGVLEFIGLDCASDSLCAIFEIEVDPLECTGDGEYSIVLNFEYQNVTNEFFDVFSNGVFVGFYAYADLPVTIENFPEREAEYDLIQICDNDNPNCCGVHEFIGLDCEETGDDCNIFEINVDPLECTGEGVYSLYLDFEYENVTNEFFEVYSNGVFVGFYPYADLPIIIEEFPEREAEYDIITICDNDNEDCCQSHEFIGLDCEENEDCHISELFAEAGECNDEGFFYIDFEFDYDNVGDLGFVVQGNGMIYDTFEYGEPFYTVGPLEADCETIYELVVTDIQFPDCQADFAFEEEICCPDGSCQISGLEAEVYDCDSIGDLVFVDLWFNVENPDANGFIVAGNGIVYDTFEYGEPFYTVGPIEADCETIYEFVVTDLENPDCSDDLGFDGPLCCEDPEACSIDSLTILETDCIDDVYIIVLDLEYSNTGELGFDLFIDSTFHSFHLYETLPITIEVPKNEYPDPFLITVCDNDNESCCLSVIYDFDMIDSVDRIPDDEVSVVLSHNEINVSMEGVQNKVLRIFGVDGRLTHQNTFVDNIKIETGQWHSGLYILYIETDAGYYSQKLMIIN